MKANETTSLIESLTDKMSEARGRAQGIVTTDPDEAKAIRALVVIVTVTEVALANFDLDRFAAHLGNYAKLKSDEEIARN